MKRLYRPGAKPMSVALFMSGSGTNAVKVLELEQVLRKEAASPFTVAAICTDNPRSNAGEIGKRFDVPVFVHDLDDFAKQFSTVRVNMSIRPRYFEMVLNDLEARNVSSDLIVLAGYMVLVTLPLLEKLVVNVHPADLSVRDKNGNAIYIGANAVRDAVLERRDEIRASTHIVTEEMDQGPVLLVSEPVKLFFPPSLKNEDTEAINAVADAYQDRLKEMGDWVILPRTLLEISNGNFGISDNGVMHYMGQPIPRGYDVSTETPK